MTAMNDLRMYSYSEVEMEIIRWAEARKIIPNSTPAAQLLKAVSELGELCDAEGKKDIAKIKEVVSKVDTLLAQVLIEAIIMEVSINDTLNYGVTAGQRPKQFGSDPRVVGGGVMNNGGNPIGTGQSFLGGLASSASNFPSSAGLSYFMQLGKNWDIAANALATDSRINVVQRPRVLTSHATPGSFQVGSEVPFITGTFSGAGFGNSTQIQRQFVGVALDVVPFITPDSLVVMEINQTIDQLGPSVKVDNNEIP